MLALVVWSLAGIGIYIWNLQHPYPHSHYIGIRFTDQMLGTPLHGSWLCAALALYCLVRYFVRKARKKERELR